MLLGSTGGFPFAAATAALGSGGKESAGRAAREKVVVVVSKRKKRKEVAKVFFMVGLPCLRGVRGLGKRCEIGKEREINYKYKKTLKWGVTEKGI